MLLPFLLQLSFIFGLFNHSPYLVNAAMENKPHLHQGILPAYDNSLLPCELTLEQEQQLNAGKIVSLLNERTADNNGGRGAVVQDVHASSDICIDNICNLEQYPSVVPNVKAVHVYDNILHNNGTRQFSARMDVGALGLRLRYFLRLTRSPHPRNTLTWTLDHRHSSDLDDSVGHWQVMKHPNKGDDWSRVLYSTQIRLFPWVPPLVVQFVTKRALIESTSWVKRVSEEQAKKRKPSTTATTTAATRNPPPTASENRSLLPSWLRPRSSPSNQ